MYSSRTIRRTQPHPPHIPTRTRARSLERASAPHPHTNTRTHAHAHGREHTRTHTCTHTHTHEGTSHTHAGCGTRSTIQNTFYSNGTHSMLRIRMQGGGTGGRGICARRWRAVPPCMHTDAYFSLAVRNCMWCQSILFDMWCDDKKKRICGVMTKKKREKKVTTQTTKKKTVSFCY